MNTLAHDLSLYLRSGLSIIPVHAKEKKPLVKWKEYQERKATPDEAQAWANSATSGQNGTSIGIAAIAGPVSGGLECIDVDAKYDDTGELWTRLRTLIQGMYPELFERLVIHSTQSKGYHILYRAPVTEGNMKLAMTASRSTIIETRGAGGYFLIPPTAGYEAIQGSIADLPAITLEERDALLALCRSFNALSDAPVERTAANSAVLDSAPGADFNQRGNVLEILENYGWKVMYKIGEIYYLRRPGKATGGCSATLNYYGNNKLHVFSSNAAPFDSERAYDPFAVYAFLECRGNFKTAARRLAEMGYGNPNSPVKPSIKTEDYTPPAAGTYHLTELGNAMRFVDAYRGKVLFDHHSEQFYVWDGKRWQKDEEQKVYALASKLYAGLYKEIEDYPNADDRKAAARWATASEQRKTIANSLALAVRGTDLATTSERFDRDPLLLNLRNGSFHLDEYALYEHHPGSFQTKLIDINFEEDAACPRWMEHLDTWFDNDKEMIKFIQRACGYSLSGLLAEQCLFFIYGTGKNGKSLFLQVLEMIFGDYYQKAPAELIIAKRNESSNTNDVARLRGARLVVAQELPENKRFDESKLKDLTGDDKLVARFLRQEFFEFRPVHKLWIYGNHKPVITGTDYGIWRRIKLIPFVVTIPEEKRIATDILIDELKAELPGILKWMIEGYYAWRKDGLQEPAAVTMATEAYRTEMDALGGFVEQHIVEKRGMKTLATDVYKRYKEWCEATGEYQIKTRSFSSKMQERGFVSEMDSHRRTYWLGIDLLDIQQIEVEFLNEKKKENDLF